MMLAVLSYEKNKMQKSPTILITGSGGQFGKAIVLHFQQVGIPYIALTKAQLDICAPKKLKQAFSSLDFQIILNCAGFTDTEEAELNPDKAFEVNGHAVRMLATLAKEHDKFLIHFSTSCLFDGDKQEPYNENDIPIPLSIYGQSKYEGEKAIFDVSPRHIIFRTSWVFSEFGGHNSVLRFLRRGIEQRSLKVVDDQFGCPTSAYAVAKVVGEICNNLPSTSDLNGIFHFCSDEPTSWYDFTEEIFRLAREFNIADVQVSRAKTGDIPTNLKRPANGIFDTRKLRSFGFLMPKWREDLKAIMPKIKL